MYEKLFIKSITQEFILEKGSDLKQLAEAFSLPDDVEVYTRDNGDILVRYNQDIKRDGSVGVPIPNFKEYLEDVFKTTLK